ncbi:MAG: hypothetical protein JWM68_5218 [Verrucomicrobiales bacterium]|nr:hypothetical protein [Verrucomicrobiales bacterium]
MVDGFTFARPSNWKWVWDEKLAKTGLLLQIEGSKTNDLASVYFRKFSGDEGSPENRIKVWQAYFKESLENLKIRSNTNTVAGFSVVYLEMEGTSARESTPEFGVFAAVVKIKDGHFVARMSRSKKSSMHRKSNSRKWSSAP